MGSPTSQKIGDLFEKASIPVFKKLFRLWGYTDTIYKRQKSGTQFGHDLYFKLEQENLFPINVFIECKASKTFNEIAKSELTIKSYQLEKSNFPKKDIHIYFSPTRTIKLENDEVPIENDQYPFCVIDYTNKTGDHTDSIFQLFTNFGEDNEDVSAYLNAFNPTLEVDSDTSFEAIAESLKATYLKRIHSFLPLKANKSFIFMSASYWNHLKNNAETKRLLEFYLRLDASLPRLLDVVATETYVDNYILRKHFLGRFNEVKKEGGLIKILSNGGEGKSTFLLSMAKELAQTHPVFYSKSLPKNILERIRQTLSYLNTSLLPVLFLDDAAASEDVLVELYDDLANFKNGLVIVVAERYFRYKNISDIDHFENSFYLDPIEIRYSLQRSLDRVFEAFFNALQQDDSAVLDYQREKANFYKAARTTTAERFFNVLYPLQLAGKIQFQFDWVEWQKAHPNPPLEYLYLFVATFYQFGNQISLEFLKTFEEFKDFSKLELIDKIDHSKNQPIIRNQDFLQLRHEKIAEWYIKHDQKWEGVKEILGRWLANINTNFSKNLLLWTYRNREFKKSAYSALLPLNKVADTLLNYIEDNPTELAARTELSKIYQQQKKWTQAENILLELLKLDQHNLQARTELSKIYQQQKKWTQAEKVLLELLKLDQDNLQARTELSKIYQQQKKWTQAENILLELLKLDQYNLQARTELSKIYQQQKKWTEAENILLELLKLDQYNLQARTELSKIYQQQKKWTEAENILLESLEIDNQQLHPRTELSKIYQQQKKWTQAENILLESLEIDNQQLHPRTELSKIYQQQKKWTQAENILLESLEIDNQQLHPRTELSKIYQQQKKWTQAEKKLLEYIQLDSNGLHPRTELSKIYQQQKKWTEAENILLELLKLDQYNLQARTELSKTYQQQKKWTEAENILLELLKLDQYNLQARTELSKTYQQQKKWTQAENILLESLEIDNQQLHPHTELSKIYQQQKKWTQAEGMLLELLKLDQDNLQARTELSKIYQQQKKWVEAEKQLLEYIQLDPDGLHPRTELSKIYQQQKKWTEAEKQLLEYIQLEPNGLHPRTELSKIYQHQKKWTEAENILIDLLQIEPTNFRGLTEKVRLYNKWMKAVPEDHALPNKFRHAIVKSYQTNARNIPLLTIISKYLMERKQYRAAICFVQLILEKRPNDLEGVRLLIEIYGILGYGDEIRELIHRGETIIQKEPHNKFITAFNKQKESVRIKNPVAEKELSGVMDFASPYLMYIKAESGEKTRVKENKKLFKGIQNGDQVYYSTYRSNHLMANFIEPFFTQANDIIDMIEQEIIPAS